MPLLSTARSSTTLAAPLPISNQHLQAAGVALRQNQFSLLAAAPGVGKSLLASNIAVRSPMPSLYFSADSDEWTAKTRAASILTKYDLGQVDQWLNEGGKAEAYVMQALAKADHVDWCFRTDLDLDFIAYRIKANEELNGAFPRFVVVDNLGNAVADQESETAELKGMCRELQVMARKTGAHFLGLHHVVGPKENGDQPIGLGDLIGKIGKIPEVVLGLSRNPQNPTGELILTVPKNRGGKAGSHIRLPVDYSKAWIGGFK